MLEGTLQLFDVHWQLKDFEAGKIVGSQLSGYHRPLQAANFSIKYVIEGREVYCLNGQRQEVKAGEYLIVNKNSELEVYIDEDEVAKGICFYPAIEDFDFSKSGQSSTPFIEKIYTTKENKLGAYLAEYGQFIWNAIQTRTALDVDYIHSDLVGLLLADQTQIEQQLQQLSANQKQTQKELYKRLSAVYNYIEYNFSQRISIEQLAVLAHISKYHLIRNYKAIYGYTPYQHILNKRLVLAQKLKATGNYSMQEITVKTGFSDAKNLQKALKKAKK